MDKYTANREFMKSGICDIDIIATADIAKGVPQPPVEKPYPEGSKKSHCLSETPSGILHWLSKQTIRLDAIN